MTPGVLPSWLGTRAYDQDGARIGHVADVLFDTTTARAEWLLVVLLREHDRFVFVPTNGAKHHPLGVVLPLARDTVRDAPRSAAPPDQLTAAHARELFRHYGCGATHGVYEGIAEPALGPAEERVRKRTAHAA